MYFPSVCPRVEFIAVLTRFFAPDEVRGVKLGRIVKTSLQKYTHLTAKNGYLTEHLSKQFHEDSLSRSNAFVALVKSNAGEV